MRFLRLPDARPSLELGLRDRWGVDENASRVVLHRGLIGLTLTALFVLTALCVVPAASALAPDFGWLPEDRGQILRLRGMTFVASEGSANEIVLQADTARFYPDHDVADLETVKVEVAPTAGRTGFDMRCDRGRLNLMSQDFVAEGNVVGTIEGGRQFEATWVAYDEAQGVLYTDEPVLITDANGRYRGGGFKYFVHQQRFRLLGGASIVQDP